MEIAVKNLTKKYGDTTVLSDLNFVIDRGEVLGFLGPNGAGKTTTMRILTGFLAPTKGEVKISGMDIVEDSLKIRKKIGYLPENNPLYNDMQVYEYLEYIAKAKGVKKITASVREVVDVCGLKGRVGQVIGELSKGFRQRVGLAQALLGDPEIIILDEPTSGLDPNQIVEIRNLIKDIGKEKTVILSTHILSEVQASCDRAIIVHEGKIVASGTTEELIEQAKGQSNIKVVLPEKRDDVKKAITELPGVLEVKETSGHKQSEAGYLVAVGESVDLRKEIFQLCVSRNATILGMEYKTLSLEDVFRQLTRGE